MKITGIHVGKSGIETRYTYHEEDPHTSKETIRLAVVHGFCFTTEGKMVLVNHPKSGWVPPGGGVESDENIFDAVEREVLEETNMKVLHKEYIGSVDFEFNNERHVRFFCIVEPLGPFIGDPNGEIEEIKEIDFLDEDMKKHFDWGPAGERLMAVARELFLKHKKN